MTRVLREPQDPEGNRVAKTQRAPRLNRITNSKLEIRNSKQIRMIKTLKFPNSLFLDFEFLNCKLVCLIFRASEFEFYLMASWREKLVRLALSNF